LYIKQIGIPIGQEATNGFTPNYYLSTIEGIDESKIEMVLVDKFQALQYLSKEIFDLKLEKKGYYFLKYQDAIFGIIKHIGNRHNNLLPPNLRIMMEWKSIFENQNFEIYNNELRR
jgi:NOL1/NOP2/fmu family ribosome biogenesis protein